MFEVETAFLLYLIKGYTFRQAYNRCEVVLDDDQEYLKLVIKSKLSKMIEDANCNIYFKPAILRLAAGDDTGFVSLNAPTSRTNAIIARNRSLFNQRLEEVVYPLSTIGPKHLKSIESVHLDIVTPHAEAHAKKYGTFLTNRDSGFTLKDMVQELLLAASKAIRAYYPFRKNLHLTNTMRQSMTNRGRGLITYNVNRLVPEDGKSVERESSVHFEDATNWEGWAEDSSKLNDLKWKLSSLAKTSKTYDKVANFMLSAELQDEFCSWLEEHNPGTRVIDFDYISQSGIPYYILLSQFLGLPQDSVKVVLNNIQRAAKSVKRVA
jgi:hypothetical protein